MSWREELKKVAKEQKVQIKDVLALTPTYDPFYMGSDADHRRAQWAKELYDWVIEKWDDRRLELMKIGIHVGSMPHARAIHYLLLTGHPNPIRWDGKRYKGSHIEWTNLQDCFKKAKLLGYISFGRIEDHKHPIVTTNLVRADDSEIERPEDEGILTRQVSFDDISYNFNIDFKDQLDIYIWEEWVKNIQKRIPVHLEIWTEKQRELVDAVAREYWVNVQNAVGQQTYENVYSLLKRAMEESEGRPLRIIYLSDFDPRGEMTMPVGVARIAEWMLTNLAEFEGLDVKLRKVILTEEQVNRYSLPPAPVKTTESMKNRWEEMIGDSVCEIDSIETLFATDMVGILRDEFRRYIPDQQLRKFKRFENNYRNLVMDYNTLLEKRIAEMNEKANGIIRGKVKNVLKDFKFDINLDMSDKYQEILDMEEEFENEDTEWEIDDGDVNWLFDSNRGYGKQLQKYKEIRGF